MPRTIVVDGNDFYKTIVKPQFDDVVPDARNFNGVLGEFTVMNDFRKSSSKPILDLKRIQNIMQRRDASCDIIYKKLFGASIRKLTIDEFYSGVQFCRNEFYQGDLKEFRANDPYFFDNITPFFKKTVNTDLTSNAYFGDVKRITSVNKAYSTHVIDGVFTWLKVYTSAGIIPLNQTLQIADGTDYTTTPQSAFNLIKTMYDRRPQIMNTYLPNEQEYNVSAEIAQGYEQYLIATGMGNTAYVNDIQTGLPSLAYMGIPIRIQRFWTPVITDLKGSAGYAATLTIRGNFIFGVDPTYGEGPDGNTAFELWYELKEMMWYWRYFMRAGTGIALPEYVVYALTSFS